MEPIADRAAPLTVITIPVIDADQAASWDELARTTAAIPSRVLMESAGRAAATIIGSAFGGRLLHGALVVAGHGNNGGDGWVVARALAASGVPVWAVDQDRKRSPDCEANRKLALAAGVARVPHQELWPGVGVVIDALLGTGASGPPRGFAADQVKRLREARIPVVAIDGPTGLDLTTGEAHDPAPADLTVTFGGLRRGHLLARRWCGRIVVVDIGFPTPPAESEWPTFVGQRWAAAMLPRFEPDMHKGDRGRLLIIGGDRGFAGAAHYTAAAAFGAGAGLVKLAAHTLTVDALQSSFPDALTVTTALGPTLEPELVEALAWTDAIVVGPGLGRAEERVPFVTALLEHTQKPIVIDADALHVGDALFHGDAARRVLTPHLGEFRAAFPSVADTAKEDRFAATQDAAAIAGGTVLLKGVPTVIAHSGRVARVVASGNPALATGGSGDVLSGLIGAFLARGLDGPDAAALGAYSLGRAAELVADTKTARATRPGDVIAAFPDLWRALAQPMEGHPPVLLDLAAPELV